MYKHVLGQVIPWFHGESPLYLMVRRWNYLIIYNIPRYLLVRLTWLSHLVCSLRIIALVVYLLTSIRSLNYTILGVKGGVQPPTPR